MSTPRTHGSVFTVKDGTVAAISEPSLLGQTQLALFPLAPPPNPSTEQCTTEIATNDCQMHIMCVKPNEDVLATLETLAQKSGRVIVVLSGSGLISSATLTTFGFTKMYKDKKYHINNISGSVKLVDDQGIQKRLGMLTITMTGPDGQAIVGCLDGPLIAAVSNVEVIAISY